jgi:hypothetical protein
MALTLTTTPQTALTAALSPYWATKPNIGEPTFVSRE